MVHLLVGVLLLFQTMVLISAPWKSEPLRLLALCTFGTLAATWTLWRIEPGHEPCWQVRHAPVTAAVVLLGWVMLSAFRSGLAAVSGFEALRYAGGVLVFISVAYGFPRRDVYWVGRAAVLALMGAVLSGLLVLRAPEGRPLGAFGDEQLLAAVLCVLLPLGVAMGQCDPHPYGRILAALGVLAGLPTLLLTANRTAWVGAAVGIGLFLCLEFRLRPKQARKRRVPLAAILILLTAMASFALLSGRAPETLARVGTLGRSGPDATFLWRQEMWGAATEMIRERPWFGWGAGTFPIQQARFRPEGRTPREVLLVGASLSESAHNSYLQVAAELGVPGLLLYLAVPVLLIYNLLRRLTRSRPGIVASLTAASVGAVVAQAICGYANPAWEFAQCSTFQWFAFGAAALMSRTGKRMDEGRGASA